MPSFQVLLYRPEISGVAERLALFWSGRLLFDSSYITLAPKLACLPRSSGRPVMTFRVAPMPPGVTSARTLLYTWICDTASAARLLKSKARPDWSPRLAVGIWRPLSSTRFRSGPTPRTVTRAPSPRLRSIDTPLMRCSASARLVSGNLPMSSAAMPSTKPSELRFRFSVDCMLARMPVTTTVLAAAGAAVFAGSAALATAAVFASCAWA